MSVSPDSAPIVPDNFYYLPLTYSYGSQSQMNFGDAIYYLAAWRGLPVRITTEAVAVLMNGDRPDSSHYDTLRHHFMNNWKEARSAGWLAECTPDTQKAEKNNTNTLRLTYRSPKRIYTFDLPGFTPGLETERYILKPRGYLENGWIKVIEGVYPKRLLNFLLYQIRTQPPGRPLPEAALLKDFMLNMTRLDGYTVHPGRVSRALAFLHEVGVIDRHNGQCWVNEAAFTYPPPRPETTFTPGQPVYEADWLTAQAEDTIRAQAAGEILELGRWPRLFFWRIYTGLADLSDRQRAWLRQCLAAHPPTSQRNRLEWVYLLRQAREV